jgi:hypothetical protein
MHADIAMHLTVANWDRMVATPGYVTVVGTVDACKGKIGSYLGCVVIRTTDPQEKVFIVAVDDASIEPVLWGHFYGTARGLSAPQVSQPDALMNEPVTTNSRHITPPECDQFRRAHTNNPNATSRSTGPPARP